MTRRVDAADDSEQSTRVIAGVRPVPVFDVVEGEALPEVCTCLAGEDSPGACAALVQCAGSIGFIVQDHTFDGETNGECSHAFRRIRIEAPLSTGREAQVPVVTAA